MNRLTKILFIIILFFVNQVCPAQVEKSLKKINGKEVILHKVLPNETWVGIARTFNLSLEDLKSVNPGITSLKEGQIINVPLMPSFASEKKPVPAKPDAKTEPVKPVVVKQSTTNALAAKHTVKEKETLFGIAKKYGVTVENLKKWNGDIQTVRIGQVINVSATSNKATAPLQVTETKPAANAKPIAESKTETKEKIVAAKTDKIELIKQVKDEVTSAKPENNTGTVYDKTVAEVTPAKNEVNDKTPKEGEVKTSSKSKSGSVVKEYTETGMAAWIKDGSLNQNKYYALHRTAPLGTIVKVNNRMNGDYVFVKVVGQLPSSDENEKQIIKISEAAARKIGAINEYFQVELNYGVLN